MARANRRERIFRNEADRLLFYQTLGEACERLEGDCQQAGHAQRCKREPTSPPVPCPEIQVTTRFKRISPVCQDLLTDAQCPMHNAPHPMRHKKLAEDACEAFSASENR